MTTKHTPGPWHWTTGDEATHAELLPDGAPEIAHDSILYHGADWSIKPANARLIAAAPETAAERERLKALNAELLEAAKAALAKICGDGWDGSLGHHPDNPLPTQLRRAIAKAEGR